MKRYSGANARSRYSDAVASLAASQKSGAGVPAYLRWVNRGLGRRAAGIAYIWGVSPNAVTAISAVVSLAALILVAFAPPTVIVAAGAAVLLLIGYALDSADGQLARLTGRGSVAGEWLDHVVDAARLPAFHLAIAVSLYNRTDVEGKWPVGAALLFMLLSSVWFFGQILAGNLGPAAQDAPGGTAPVWVSFVKIPYDVGFLYLCVFALPAATVFISLYVALFLLTAAVAALSLWRKYAALLAMSRLPAASAAATPDP